MCRSFENSRKWTSATISGRVHPVPTICSLLLLLLDPALRPVARMVPLLFSLPNHAFQAAVYERVVVGDPAGRDVVAEHDPIFLLEALAKERLRLHLRIA